MLPLILLAAEVTIPKPPTIDPNIAAEFWRAQSQFLAIKPEFEQRDAAVKAALVKLSKACGENFVPRDDDGLRCVPKPPEAPKDKK